jgi:NTP pyrophosphatase (non-canonical NTP hydrolase)
MSTSTTLDEQTTVAALRSAVDAFVGARDWYVYHTPKNLAMSIAIETAELLEHYQWLTPEASLALTDDAAQRAAVADELADVLIYCLSFANCTGIDVSDAVLRKLARNETRFPVERVRGRLGSE